MSDLFVDIVATLTLYPYLNISDSVNSSWYLSVLGIERTESMNWLLYCKAHLLIFFYSNGFTMLLHIQHPTTEGSVWNNCQKLTWLRRTNTFCV